MHPSRLHGYMSLNTPRGHESAHITQQYAVATSLPLTASRTCTSHTPCSFSQVENNCGQTAHVPEKVIESQKGL